MPPESSPRSPGAPEAGPRGGAEDLDALRRAVGRAEGPGPGRLVAVLLLLALSGLVAAAGWAFATNWISGPRGSTSALRPPPIPKAALKPGAAPAPPPTVVAPPVAGSAAGLEPLKPL